MKSRTILLAGLLVLAAVSQSPAQVERGRDVPVRLLPDLKASLISAKGTKAIVRVANVCRGDAPAARVQLTVSLDADKKSKGGLLIEKDVPPLYGTASTNPGKRSADIVFTLDGSHEAKSFDGKFIK